MTWKPQTGVPIISARSCAWKKSFAGDCQCWENRSEGNIPLPVGPVCVRRPTQPFTFSPPPPPSLQRLVKRRHPPAGSCCFQLSEDKTAQQGEPDVWLPAKTMICVEGTVIPNVRCSLARQGSMPIPYNPRTCFPVEAATSTVSTHLCGIKQNETHKSSCLRPFCGSRIWSHHPWSCFTHHDAWRQVKGETEDKAGGRGKERKSACNSSKTAED